MKFARLSYLPCGQAETESKGLLEGRHMGTISRFPQLLGISCKLDGASKKRYQRSSPPLSTMKKPDPPKAAKFKWVKGAAAAVVRVVSSSGKFPALERPLCECVGGS